MHADARLRRLIGEIARLLEVDEEARREVLDGSRVDLAVAYAAGFRSLATTFLRWLEECGGQRSVEKPFCREVQEHVQSLAEGLGITTYFSVEIKRLLLRAYADFSPFPLAPRWMLTFAMRYKIPLHEALSGIGPREMVVRAPYYLALSEYIEGLSRRYTDLYSARGSDAAFAMAAYIYYEFVEPFARPADLLRRELGIGAAEGFSEEPGTVKSLYIRYARLLAARGAGREG